MNHIFHRCAREFQHFLKDISLDPDVSTRKKHLCKTLLGQYDQYRDIYAPEDEEDDILIYDGAPPFFDIVTRMTENYMLTRDSPFSNEMVTRITNDDNKADTRIFVYPLKDSIKDATDEDLLLFKFTLENEENAPLFMISFGTFVKEEDLPPCVIH